MKSKLILFFLFAASLHLNAQDGRPKIVYIYDALCGWCYGFSPVIVELYVRYQDQLEFDVISGGMITGKNAGPATDRADSILQAYQAVERRTGAEFGKAFLEGTLRDSQHLFSSEKPAVAMAVFRSHLPEKVVFFATALQKAIYHDGMSPDEYEGYKAIVDEFGLDPEDFVRRMKEKTFRIAAREDFRVTREFQVDGFPTVLLLKDNKIKFLTRGYIDYQALERRLLESLAE